MYYIFCMPLYVFTLIGISCFSPNTNTPTSEPIVKTDIQPSQPSAPQTNKSEEETLEPEMPKKDLESLKSPVPDLIVMNGLLNEKECAAEYAHCDCLKENGEWMCFPKYHSNISHISTALLDEMNEKSWRGDCPRSISELRLVHVLHWSGPEEIRWGELVIAAEEAQNIVDIFEEIYLARFIIPQIRRIDHYEANDDLSMAANNTSAFNCRTIKGTEVWSQHSFGDAIDINPLWNPWVRGSIIDPPEAADFVDRSNLRPGMITDGDVVVRAFSSRGWKWGGHWNGKKDYQHFSVNGE
jgi:hypothetical protein